ncbi:hypothetical protein CDAR_222181 [Caerostris darwini]|uniref:Uncharacterized protein n=1 Tax=Caerostris darwini TaxID=1538125 RepID=A0AAV4P694_9ARAC|nr:hypothetical protein CDAR_222181 [Caerostris darwini]
MLVNDVDFFFSNLRNNAPTCSTATESHRHDYGVLFLQFGYAWEGSDTWTIGSDVADSLLKGRPLVSINIHLDAMHQDDRINICSIFHFNVPC